MRRRGKGTRQVHIYLTEKGSGTTAYDNMSVTGESVVTKEKRGGSTLDEDQSYGFYTTGPALGSAATTTATTAIAPGYGYGTTAATALASGYQTTAATAPGYMSYGTSTTAPGLRIVWDYYGSPRLRYTGD